MPKRRCLLLASVQTPPVRFLVVNNDSHPLPQLDLSQMLHVQDPLKHISNTNEHTTEWKEGNMRTIFFFNQIWVACVEDHFPKVYNVSYIAH